MDNIENIKQEIGEKIKRNIKYNSLSLRKVAEKIDGISYTQIHRVTSGKSSYTIDSLLNVLQVLDLEVEIREKGSKTQ